MKQNVKYRNSDSLGLRKIWEQRKLGEVIERFEYGLNAAAIDYDGVHKYIRITDIDDVSHKFLKSNLTTPKIDFQNTDTEMYKLKEGDILFARTGASVGKTYLYDINDGELYFAGFLIRGHVNSSYNAKFVYQNTLTENYDLFIKITSQRSGQPGVNSKEYAEFKLYIPSKEEQDKISSVLTDFDNLITLHQRKLENLKLKKKALLQKLFPKNGEQFPELRFPGFTDAWEQRKLGDIANSLIAGGDVNKSELLDVGEYPVIANALTSEGVIGYYNDSFRVEAPAVTITGRGDIGIAVARHKNFTPVVRLLSLTTNHDVNFLENAINNLSIISESTGVPQLTVPQLACYKINITSIEEERIIGDFFVGFDNLITLHQRKLEHLQLQKKALLQQMFV